jgi:hypothetical protein
MNPSPVRKFSILDAMILVAASALGLALIRFLYATGRYLSMGRPWYAFVAQYTVEATVPFLITWTLAFLVLRLRQPRPRLRRLLRQPGMVACGAAVVAIAFEVLWVLP